MEILTGCLKQLLPKAIRSIMKIKNMHSLSLLIQSTACHKGLKLSICLKSCNCVLQSSHGSVLRANLFFSYCHHCLGKNCNVMLFQSTRHQDIEPVTSNSEKLQGDKSISICSLRALQSQIIVSLSAPNKSICFFPSVVQGFNSGIFITKRKADDLISGVIN